MITSFKSNCFVGLCQMSLKGTFLLNCTKLSCYVFWPKLGYQLLLYYGYIHGGYSNFCLSRCYCRIVVVAKQKNCCVPSSANLRCLLIQFYFNFSFPPPLCGTTYRRYIQLHLTSAPPVPMCGPTYQKYIQLYLTLAPPAPMCGTT